MDPSCSLFFLFFFHTHLLSSFWTSRGHRCRPFFPRFLTSIFITHRVQQSHCSLIFHRGLLTHALALSASQFVHKKKSQRIYSSMRSAGLELTKLTYTRLEDNLIRHRGDRQPHYPPLKRRDTRLAGHTGGPLSYPSGFISWVYRGEYFSSSTWGKSEKVH